MNYKLTVSMVNQITHFFKKEKKQILSPPQRKKLIILGEFPFRQRKLENGKFLK